MSSRVAVALAVCALVAVNSTLLLLGRSDVPQCMTHRDTNKIECPEAPDTEGCDVDRDKYTTEMRWLKPVPSIPFAYEECDEEDSEAEHKKVILRTENECGFPGRYTVKENGPFGTKPIDNEDNLVIRKGEAPCYREFNCKWVVSTTNYVGFATAEYNSEGYYYPDTVWQEKCTAYQVSTTMIQGLTWEGANWTDCFGESE